MERKNQRGRHGVGWGRQVGGYGEACVIQESFQWRHKPFGIQNEAFPYSVVGALGDAEVLAEGKDSGKLSGDPGINEGCEEVKTVRGIRNDD